MPEYVPGLTSRSLTVRIVFLSLIVACLQTTCLATTDDANGNWSREYIELRYTPEADLMARTGDIDNLTSGWPGGYDPFSGQSTPARYPPWMADYADPHGTDRMMAASGNSGQFALLAGDHKSAGRASDDHSYSYLRPVILNYNLSGMDIRSAILQIFIYGIQPSASGSRYQARLNGVRVEPLENAINSLNQTGHIGKLINVSLPEEYFYLLYDGNLSVDINDTDAESGDWFSVDFVKLLINPRKVCRPCCGCYNEIKEFRWVGTDADMVGRGDYGYPDNVTDGHFVLELCLPYNTEIRSIAIYGTGSDGSISNILPQHSSQVWHSADRYWDILGVFYRGHQLNTHHIPSLGNFSCNVKFDLYASDLSGFNSGKSYLVQVEFGKLQKLITI